MADARKTNVTSSGEKEGFVCNCSCGSPEDMTKMMQDFFNEEEGTFCAAMIQRMCGIESKDAAKK